MPLVWPAALGSGNISSRRWRQAGAREMSCRTSSAWRAISLQYLRAHALSGETHAEALGAHPTPCRAALWHPELPSLAAFQNNASIRA